MSQHIRRLEGLVGRELFARDTHRVALTGDGEVMTGFAKSILDQQDLALRYFARPELRGRIRLGVSEDLVLGRLPEILRQFRSSHPLIELDLPVDLSEVLHGRLTGGNLDLVFAKRGHAGGDGTRIWGAPRESRCLWWSARSRASPGRGPWSRCGAMEFNGVRAAVLAGLGVAVVFALTSRCCVADGPAAALAEVISAHHWAVGPQRTVQR